MVGSTRGGFGGATFLFVDFVAGAAAGFGADFSGAGVATFVPVITSGAGAGCCASKFALNTTPTIIQKVFFIN